MEKLQTAVEWLEDELAFFLKDIIENKNHLLMTNLFEQAKAMEKEQIINAAYNGADYEHSSFDNAEQYYNETYGKTN